MLWENSITPAVFTSWLTVKSDPHCEWTENRIIQIYFFERFGC